MDFSFRHFDYQSSGLMFRRAEPLESAFIRASHRNDWVRRHPSLRSRYSTGVSDGDGKRVDHRQSEWIALYGLGLRGEGECRNLVPVHPTASNARCYLKIIVRLPSIMMRCWQCQNTARDSTTRSIFLPIRASRSGVSCCSTRCTSCSMIGPSSRSAVT